MFILLWRLMLLSSFLRLASYFRIYVKESWISQSLTCFDIHPNMVQLITRLFIMWIQCRQHLELLLDSIPSMFQDNKTADSAFGAAVKVCYPYLLASGLSELKWCETAKIVKLKFLASCYRGITECIFLMPLPFPSYFVGCILGNEK